MLPLFERAVGALILLFILSDIVLTFLYARIGTGIMGGYLASLVWRLFLWLSTRFGRYGAKALSLCGPIVVSLVISTWTLALMCGAALVIYPKLGESVRANTGPTLSADAAQLTEARHIPDSTSPGLRKAFIAEEQARPAH